jgi:peptidoglycan hydrolase-like protein with peptidoglycan-binding domain
MPRTLIEGSTDDDVSYLQEKLNSFPPAVLPPLVVDGDFTAQTRDRVEEFQSNNGLMIDGNVGPSTWTKLLEHATTTSPGFFVLGRHLTIGSAPRFCCVVSIRCVCSMAKIPKV